MKLIVIKILVPILVFICGITPTHSQELVPLAERFSIASKVLNEERTYLVSKPSNFNPDESYPLIILLDGLTHLRYVAGTLDNFQANGRMPASLTVAIENTDRARDLTPPSSSSNSGEADKFLAFIENELLPDLENKYALKPYRMLIGHSAGGTFTLYTLLTKPELFNAYISISPPLYWDEEALIKSAELASKTIKNMSIDFIYSLGNEDTDALGAAHKLAAILELSIYWEEQYKLRPFKWSYLHYPQETHMSTIMPTVTDGIKKIFADWYLHDPFSFYEYSGLSGLEKHYDNLSDRMNYEVNIPYRTLAKVAQVLFQRERFTDAEEIMKKAESLYPEIHYPKYELARIYQKLGDLDKTRSYLNKTLSMHPDHVPAKKMLSEISQKKR